MAILKSMGIEEQKVPTPTDFEDDASAALNKMLDLLNSLRGESRASIETKKENSKFC